MTKPTTLERAGRFLDNRLTGSQAVIAISVMAEFADRLMAERDEKIARLRASLRHIQTMPVYDQDDHVRVRDYARRILDEVKTDAS